MWSSWWIVAGDPAEVIGVGINHGTFVPPRKEDVTMGQDDTLGCKVRELTRSRYCVYFVECHRDGSMRLTKRGGMMSRAHKAQLKGRSYAEVTTVDFATGH